MLYYCVSSKSKFGDQIQNGEAESLVLTWPSTWSAKVSVLSRKASNTWLITLTLKMATFVQ